MTGFWVRIRRAHGSLSARSATPWVAYSDERAVHFIFHTGHVGSTLVSRLLDETGDVLSLREPLPLRTLADAMDVLTLPESLAERRAVQPAI